MSTPQRKRHLREAREAELARQAQARQHQDALSMYERIEEADLSDELKDILHRLASGERE
jgi:hypothetical protein